MVWDDAYAEGNNSISEIPGNVVIYGTSWCAKTQIVKRFFDKIQVSYKFVDLEKNPEAVKELRWITGGFATHPTVVIDGQSLIEPSERELEMVMAKYKS